MTFLPTSKVPATTQRMWEIALADLERAEILLEATKKDTTATPEDIERREREARARRGICKTINFLITNASDINAVIAKKKKSNSSN